MSSATAQPNPPVSTQPTSMDWLFLLSCAVALALVAWFGKINYTEANKTETAKRNGEAVVAWMQDATAGRFEPGFGVAACAGTAPPPRVRAVAGFSCSVGRSESAVADDAAPEAATVPEDEFREK